MNQHQKPAKHAALNLVLSVRDAVERRPNVVVGEEGQNVSGEYRHHTPPAARQRLVAAALAVVHLPE